MTVRELKNRYKRYDVILFGKPLGQPTIPFTFLPKDKSINDMEVIEFKVIEKPFTQYGVSFKDLQPIKPKAFKGTVYAYVK